MPETMMEWARTDRALREEASAAAEELLSRLNLNAVQEYGAEALDEFCEALRGRLKEMSLTAFRNGKQAAWNVIAKVPPVTREQKAPGKISEVELEYFAERYLPSWIAEFEHQNRVAADAIATYAKRAEMSGRLGKEIEGSIIRDWETDGRIFGTWKRFVKAAAAEFVGLWELCGQECGYLGVGQ